MANSDKIVISRKKAPLSLYNKALHDISLQYKGLLAQKGLDIDLSEGFMEAISDYFVEEIRNNSIETYNDYMRNLTALLENIATMNKKQLQIFTKTLKKWLDTGYTYKDIDHPAYERIRNIGFNRLFSQLGDPEVKKRATIRATQSELAATLLVKEEA